MTIYTLIGLVVLFMIYRIIMKTIWIDIDGIELDELDRDNIN